MQLSKYITECTVLRDGQWVKVDSRHLVPGDVVKMRSDWLLPADLIIIQGIFTYEWKLAAGMTDV